MARAAVLLFFFASGATGLVLEVAWTRILSVVFGNTVYAASTVLTAYMMGLALGSLALGRMADGARRPLVLYGCLEIGVGLYAMLFPLISSACLAFYQWFYRVADPGFVLLTAVRFLLSAAVLVPPTFLMGGTLPVLGRHLSTGRSEPGQEVGYLYGINTLGAVLGCSLAGFVFLHGLGIQGTLIVAAAVAISVGGAAAGLGLRAPASEAPSANRGPPRRPASETAAAEASFPVLATAFAITGFCSLACEVIWVRILLFVMMTTVYSFATMLTAFLAGLGAGSFISSRWIVPRLRRPLFWFGVLQVFVGLGVFLTVPLLANLGTIDLYLGQRFESSDVRWTILVRFLDALVVLFVPTLLMGMAFPLAATACLRGSASVGKRTGELYAANTIGCVLGSFAAGFVLLPVLGAQRSLLTVVTLNLLVGVALVCRSLARTLSARLAFAAPLAAVAAAAFALTPSNVFHATINTFHSPSAIVFLEEHSTATVTVHQLPNGERLIASDGVNVAGLDFMLRTTQKLQGYIPLCLHPNPRRVVQIGFGSGETARVGIEFGVPEYTVIEISPAIFRAGVHFEVINRGSYRDPRIRKIIMDGKNFALLADEKFDIVMNDSIYPGSSGSSALYTVDHFQNCRERLAEGGLFSCWVPLDLRDRELRMMLRSFQSVFPHSSFWVASNCLNKHSLFLGSLKPLDIDLTRLKEVMRRPHVAKDLAAIAIEDAYDLLDCHVADEASIRKLVEGDPLNTDDRPLLEFSCAVRLPWEQCLRGVLRMIRQCRAPIDPCLRGFADETVERAELARRFEATNLIFEAQFAQLAGLPTVRRQKLDLALKTNPGEAHVRTCEEELSWEIADLKKAFEGSPGSEAYAYRLADKLYAALRSREAAALYEPIAARTPPPAPLVFLRLAEIHFGEGKMVEAERILLRCLELWPGSADAHDRLGGLYLRLGRKDDALRHIQQALALQPENELFKVHRDAILGQR